LLASKKIEPTLSRVRGVRNDACHGNKTFDAEDYRNFARQMVARDNFREWDAKGPFPPKPAPDVGVLHHHLTCARRVRPSAREGPALGLGRQPIPARPARGPVRALDRVTILFVSPSPQDTDRLVQSKEFRELQTILSGQAGFELRSVPATRLKDLQFA